MKKILFTLTLTVFASTLCFEKTTELASMIKEISETSNNQIMKDKTVRISLGYFQPDQTEKVASILENEFKDLLIPAIKKLKGNISFYVGIDREKHTVTNVSFWQTNEDAKQMATLKEMLDMRVTFEALGVKFIDITNHEIVWELPE